MARWTKELAVIIALAIASALIAPRVLLPRRPSRTPYANTLPAHTEATVRPEIVQEVPFGRDSPLSPLPAQSGVNSAVVMASDRPAGRGVRAPESPVFFSSGAIRRRSGRWQVDLDRLPDPGQVLSGVQMQHMGDESSGQGFAITSTDAQGLMRAAGIRPGDVLVAVNDIPTLNPDQALDAIGLWGHASSLTFRFRRAERSYTIHVDIHGDSRRLRGPLIGASLPSRGS